MSTETPDMVYGRLLESAHISGYTFERWAAELDWLLDGDRWRSVGPGYDDINAFLASIDMSAYNLGEKRPGLVRRIKELQPDASTRAIAAALGVGKSTVGRDLAGPDGTPASGDAQASDPGVSHMGREEAERLCEQIRAELAKGDWIIVKGLLGGGPPAVIAGGLATALWRGEREHAGDQELCALMREHVFGPRIDAVLAWPHGGSYADEIESRDDGLRAILLAQRAAA